MPVTVLILSILLLLVSACAQRRHLGSHPVLFFDGTCGFCHASLRLIIPSFSRTAIPLRFCPLQAPNAARLLATHFSELPNSLILVDGQRILTHSDCVLWVLATYGKLPVVILANLAFLIPSPLRDLIYRLIARNRYILSKACPLPSQHVRSLFIQDITP